MSLARTSYFQDAITEKYFKEVKCRSLKRRTNLSNMVNRILVLEFEQRK